MRDLALAAGHQPGAIRTAMSRLRSSGLVQVEHHRGDQARYVRGALARSVQELVASPLARPEGLTLVVYTFATEDARKRQLVRETLRLHGFQRLAQNTYISGYVDAEVLQAAFERDGIGDHVFVFQTREDLADNVQARLSALFDLPKRCTRAAGVSQGPVRVARRRRPHG
jgi:DNA-binding transcriptional regulator PaaX